MRSDHLQRDDLLLVVAEQVGVEANKMLTDVQAALQQYPLPQCAHELVKYVLHCTLHIKHGYGQSYSCHGYSSLQN